MLFFEIWLSWFIESLNTSIITFTFLKWAYSTRFGLVLNAIRDNEDKAEAMGIYTMRYKIIGWMVSAFFVGLAGGIMGHINGYIEPTEIAFAGPTFGVFKVLMAMNKQNIDMWTNLISFFVLTYPPIFTIVFGAKNLLSEYDKIR